MEWIDLPCIFNNTKTLETHFRVDVISFFRTWKEDESEKTDTGSTAMFIVGRKSPIRIVLSLEVVQDLLPECFIPFILANKETVIINITNVYYYRDFIEEGKEGQKFILFMAPMGDMDSFHIVRTNPSPVGIKEQE